MTLQYWLHKLLDYVLNNSDGEFHDSVVLRQLEAWVSMRKVLRPDHDENLDINDEKEGADSNIIQLYPYSGQDMLPQDEKSEEEIDRVFAMLRQAVGNDISMAKAIENKFQLEIKPLYHRSKMKDVK